MAATMTLNDKLANAAGRPAGFDYMRLALATCVILMHSVSSSYGAEVASRVWATPAGMPVRLILPMFFALSGFLVAGSMERSRTLFMFLSLRIVRIYPALTVEVLLSALLIGPLVTSRDLLSYFSAPSFFLYLMNVTGHIHYFLPGVFSSNPVPNVVNGQLWTVPFELLCYISLAVLIVAGARKTRSIVPIGAVALGVLIPVYEGARSGWHLSVLPPGMLLIVTFLMGVTLYLYRREIPWSRTVFAAALGLSLLGFAAHPYGDVLSAFTVPYLTAFLGLCNPPRSSVVAGADYSYGIYLYGFVIQQLVMDLAPWARQWYWNALICVPGAALFAAFSWHLVEKPALNLRHVATRLDTRLMRLRRTSVTA